MQKTFTTKSDTETISLGFRLGRGLRGGEFIALTGDLGGGKTQFTKGIAKGLGITETIVSPTFTIERIYQGTINNKQSTEPTSLRGTKQSFPDTNYELLDTNYNIQLHHFDLYRTLEDKEIAESIKDLATEGDNVVVVEWPENISGIVPDNNLLAEFKYVDENTREIVLNYSHPEWERRIQELELNNEGQNDTDF